MCTTESAANKKNTTKVANYTLPKLSLYIEMKQNEIELEYQVAG